MNSITLHEMKFFAHHGVCPQERLVGNHFEVTLKVYCDMQQAMLHDDLSGTVNYAALYTVVDREMRQPSQLLEHVAHRIIQAIKAEFPQVTGGAISISKLTPPFKSDLKKVEIQIHF